MTNLLNMQLAWLAANSKHTFTVYKHNKNGKVLTNCEFVNQHNAIQENVSILQNAPTGSTVEETEIDRNYYGEDVGDVLVNVWQRKVDKTWERI